MRRVARHAEAKARFPRTSAGDQRLSAGAPLDQDEGDEGHRTDREEAEDQRIGPAAVGAFVEGEQDREQPDRQRGDAAIVDPPVGGGRLVLRHDPPGDEHGEGGDRQVEEEDPAPAEGVGQRAAEQRPDGVAETGGAEDQAAGKPRPARRQEGIGHAEDRRPHHRPADAHHRARRKQDGDVGGEAAEHARRPRRWRPPKEDAPPAEHVGQAAAGDDEHAEDQGVAVDHPLHGGDVGAEVGLDRRQGDRKGGKVVGDDEDREAHRHQPENRGARWPLCRLDHRRFAP